MSGAKGQARLSLDRNLVLAAGAGSGKTYTLVTVALGLYGGAGGRPPLDPMRVWAVTFTEKAAAELRSRIADRLARIVRAGGELASEPELAAALAGRPVRAERWLDVARAVPLAPVGTFHSLCGQLLRRHAAEARLDPRFAILDEQAAGELFERVREEALVAELSDATGAARRLVRELGSLDALRDALAFLHAKLAEEGRDPPSLVDAPGGRPLPPFDEAAAREALGEAGAALAASLDRLAASDHERLRGPRAAIEREAERLGRCEPERLDQWYPAAAAVAGADRGRGNLPAAAKPAWEPFKLAWSAAQGAVAAVAQARVGRELVALLGRVSDGYAAQKRAHGALDFADLTRRARDLLRDHRPVRAEAKARVGALLVDEFQDTNQLQLDLVHLLCERRDAEREVAPGASCATLPLEPAVLAAVGDRKQSIYEFRGAEVSLFAALTARARAGDGFRLEALRRSFRSRPELVRFAGEVFAKVLAGPAARPYQVAWVDDEDVLLPERADPPALATAPAVELLEGDPELSADDRRPVEARLVAARIATLLSTGRLVEVERCCRPVRGADIAVLLRAFTHLEAYRRALAEQGIPSIVVKGRGFHGAREVRDLAALLLALCDPTDRFASVAVLRSPACGLSDDALVLLAAAGKLSLADHAGGCAAELPAEDALQLGRLGPLVARLSREVDRLGAGRTLALAAEELDLLPALAATFGGEQRVANVRKLLARLEGLAGRGALATAHELLAAADDPTDREPPADVAAAADERAVRILTVHASKGLEFPVVVVPELGAGERNETGAVLFERRCGLAVKPADPLGARIADPHAQEVLSELHARRDAESARLLYVALTRARDLLVLCGEKGPRGGGHSWRAQLDAAMPEQLVTRVPAAAAPTPENRLQATGYGLRQLRSDEAACLKPEARSLKPAAPAAKPRRGRAKPDPLAAELLARSLPPNLVPGRFTGAVTELAELSRCARRYFYRSVAGLAESGLGSPLDELREPGETTPALDRLRRGTLAHLLLERVDLRLAASDPRAAVERVARAAGDLDVGSPEIAAILEDAVALLHGPLGRVLVQSPRVCRELPFALEVAGSGGALLALSGQMDLLFVDADGTACIVDYKHASARGQPADAYAFQLRTYAVAARRILPPQVPIRAGVAWLRDRGDAPQLQPIADEVVAAHARLLGGLGDRLARVRASGRYEKLGSPGDCDGCGFAARCWGGAAAPAAGA